MTQFMKQLLFVFSFLISFSSMGQQLLTLEECQRLSRENYPLSKQRALIDKTSEYTVDNIAKGNYPQLSINGQATYQTDVTQVPVNLPNLNIPSPDKDQYKIYAELTQSIYNGGVIRKQKEAAEVSQALEQQKLETELYRVKERVNQLYFGILLSDEQIKLTELLKKDLQSGIDKTSAAVTEGVATKSNMDVLKAELLRADQRILEVQSLRDAFAEMLRHFCNLPEGTPILLQKPAAPSISQEVQRPELLWYERQSKGIEVQEKLLHARSLPKLNLFVQGGYGQPALNMFSTEFEPYAIGGVKLNWLLSSFYTRKKEMQILELNRQSINLQKDAFLFNTSLAMKQQNADIKKWQDLIRSDNEIILLRQSVKNTATVQLENGLITTHDYLREVNAEDQSRQNQVLHEIQLLMSIANYQFTTGN
jgi:outer membrane protein TolC